MAGRRLYFRTTGLVVSLSFLAALLSSTAVFASTVNPQNPQNGAIGLEATISGPAPSQSPTVSVPSNSQAFSNQPITVAGICQNGLLVKIFNNNVFVGSAVCKSNSFNLQVSLFSGSNSLSAIQYDALDRGSPLSNKVTVSYTPPPSQAFNGPLLSLTSSFAKRGTNPGDQLVWPISISGGNEPYALSVDWGDGSKPQLLSDSFSGVLNLTHTYQSAGTYNVAIEATDKGGETAFLQVVAVINGAVIGQSSGSSSGGSGPTKYVSKTVWWPAAAMLPLVGVAFWLGNKQALFNLRKRLESSDQNL